MHFNLVHKYKNLLPHRYFFYHLKINLKHSPSRQPKHRPGVLFLAVNYSCHLQNNFRQKQNKSLVFLQLSIVVLLSTLAENASLTFKKIIMYKQSFEHIANDYLPLIIFRCSIPQSERLSMIVCSVLPYSVRLYFTITGWVSKTVRLTSWFVSSSFNSLLSILFDIPLTSINISENLLSL